jgi:nitrogenase molybdenum-iron protein beta chain
MALDHDRNTCALHGALHLLDAIPAVVPILHANAGCGVSAWNEDPFQSGVDETCSGSRELSSTLVQEKQVVFGGTARLREQIKNTVKVLNGDLYVVVTGCVPEVTGDDVQAMVKEAREQRWPVVGLSTPGFKGHAWSGHATTAAALIQQHLATTQAEDAHPFDVNLFGLVPGQDPAWEGDLLELEGLLALLGLRANRLLGHGQTIENWSRATRARLSLVLSPWGLAPAQALEEFHGVPVLDLGWTPVGSLDAGLLLERLGAALQLEADVVARAREGLDDELRYYLSKAATGLILGHVQTRTAVVGGSAGAVGQARFLAGTLGQILTDVILTDEPAEARRGAMIATIQEVAPGAVVSFHSGQGAIAAQLRLSRPELIVGSALEGPVALELSAALVERAAPLRARPLLRRTHAGIAGAIALVEDLLAALIQQQDSRSNPLLQPQPHPAQEAFA